MRFKYHRLQIATGKIHTLEMDCFNEQHFLYWIANWNKQSNFRYWFDELPRDLQVKIASDYTRIHPTIVSR